MSEGEKEKEKKRETERRGNSEGAMLVVYVWVCCLVLISGIVFLASFVYFWEVIFRVFIILARSSC